MTDDKQVEDLGRLAFDTAGELRLLGECMRALSWQPDGYAPGDLGQVADAIQGMALRCAMHTGNTAILMTCPGATSANSTGRTCRDRRPTAQPNPDRLRQGVDPQPGPPSAA